MLGRGCEAASCSLLFKEKARHLEALCEVSCFSAQVNRKEQKSAWNIPGAGSDLQMPIFGL